ncbi:MAG: O-antigen ligase family protein [Candidatus Omnitrophica bacterium]|nr:O-antigen ligase family protein [Candidatus Omnitrophota bacterium]
MIFLIALNLTAQEKDSLIRTMVLSAIAVSILAIYQYFFGFTHILEYLNKGNTGNLFLLDTIGQKRVFLPFASPNMLAGYLIMVIPLCLIDKKRRIYILPLCIGLVLTKSLGAIISLFMVLIIYGVLRFKSNKKIVAFAAIGVLTILLIVFLRNCSQRWHFTPGFSVMMRWGYWQDTWAVIKNNIFTGVGIGNFDLPDSRFAHNSYLQIWAEMGIPGILAFIYLILGISRSAIRKLTRLGLDYKYMAIFLAWSVFLLHNSVDFTFFLPEVSFVWWLLCGLLLI